jgi:hypothetical protein
MKRIFFLVFFSSTLIVNAQDDRIEADRPGETQTPKLAGKKTFQWEAGWQREQQSEKNFRYFLPQAYLRYGISDALELRAEVTAEKRRYVTEGDLRSYGLRPVELGIKAKLAEGKGALPATSFYGLLGIPKLASADHKADHLYPRLRLLFENELNKNFRLQYNAGAEWDGNSTTPQWLYTFAPEFDLGKSFEGFVEVYGYLQNGHQPEHNLDGGLAYYPSKNCKLDLLAGVGLSPGAPDHFFSAGISIRFK